MNMKEMKLKVKFFSELNTKELYEILKSRSYIFVVEQKCIYQDLDDIDYNSLHIFLEDSSNVVAYLRAFWKEKDTIQIGRVFSLEHGIGLGEELFSKALSIIPNKMPCKRIVLAAQKNAMGFYEKFGFTVSSEEFLEDGIAHVMMELVL